VGCEVSRPGFDRHRFRQKPGATRLLQIESKGLRDLRSQLGGHAVNLDVMLAISANDPHNTITSGATNDKPSECGVNG
jgi:hypothetical protein